MLPSRLLLLFVGLLVLPCHAVCAADLIPSSILQLNFAACCAIAAVVDCCSIKGIQPVTSITLATGPDAAVWCMTDGSKAGSSSNDGAAAAAAAGPVTLLLQQALMCLQQVQDMRSYLSES